MYIGHVAIALGAKSIRRTVPLWLLVFAAQACDWGDAVLMVVRPSRAPEVVREMWTHSVPAVIVLALLFGGATWVVRRRSGEALLVAAVVISHVLADYLTGLKPTWPGGPVIGLNLYAHPLWDLALEGAVIVLGWVMYVRVAPSGRGAWRSAWVMLGALLVLQVLADGAMEYQAGVVPSAVQVRAQGEGSGVGAGSVAPDARRAAVERAGIGK